jgi:hypothetical protein
VAVVANRKEHIFVVKRGIFFTVGAFILIGPPFGLFLVTIIDVVGTHIEGKSFPFVQWFHEPLVRTSYLFGSIPAAEAGLIWSIVANLTVLRPIAKLRRIVLGSFVGALVGAFQGMQRGSIGFELFFPVVICAIPAGLLALFFPLNRWLAISPPSIAETE